MAIIRLTLIKNNNNTAERVLVALGDESKPVTHTLRLDTPECGGIGHDNENDPIIASFSLKDHQLVFLSSILMQGCKSNDILFQFCDGNYVYNNYIPPP